MDSSCALSQADPYTQRNTVWLAPLFKCHPGWSPSALPQSAAAPSPVPHYSVFLFIYFWPHHPLGNGTVPQNTPAVKPPLVFSATSVKGSQAIISGLRFVLQPVVRRLSTSAKVLSKEPLLQKSLTLPPPPPAPPPPARRSKATPFFHFLIILLKALL